MSILKHKDAYIESFKSAIVGNENPTSFPKVDSSSPYYAELNEEQEVRSFAYEVGKTVANNVSVGGGNGEGGPIDNNHNHDNRYAKIDHNHDDRYAKIVHNHDDLYYTKLEIDEWRNRLINGDLLFNKITSRHIQAGTIVAGSTIIANGAIGSAQISSLEVDKLESGVINTSRISLEGANGNLRLRGNRLQVFEGVGSEQYERVSLGDVNNDGTVYGLRVRGADGQTILYDENGVYREGITDGSINNDKISDDADIDGAKLNITSVINKINEDGTGTIHGTKIDIDGEGLSSKIYDIELSQNEHSETIERQQAQIQQNTENINLKVSNQKYTEDMSAMESRFERAESEIDILNEGIKLSATKTEVTNQIGELKDFVSDEVGSLAVGGTNYINNSAPRKATVDNSVLWDRTLNGTRRLTYWQDYNENVDLPQAGYHPHIDLDTFHFPCIALINRNGTYNLANRELNLKQEIHNVEEFITPNETYTLSFDAYVDTPNFSLNGGLYHRVVESSLYNYHSGFMDIVFSSDEINTWKRVSYTFDTRVGIDTSEPIYLSIYAHNNPEGSSYIKNIKLEKGNMMSQWTPSQFDVDDSLNDVIESTKDYVNESIESYNSSIDIKFDSITSRVERTENGINDVDSKYTEIKQTIDSIDLTGVVKFKDLYTPGATVITGENIETGTVSVESLKSNNSNPIIKLFPTTASDGTRSYCSLDATKQYEQGVGTAIRLKWDSMNYLLQRRSGVEFYMEPREQGASFNFQSDYGHHTSKYESRIITKDGTLCFRRNSNTDESTSSLYFYTGSQNYDRKLLTSYDMSNSVSSTSTNAVATAYAVKQAYDKAVSAYNVGNHSHPYASSSHSHSGYASSSHSHSGSSWNSLTVTKLYGGYLYLENGSSTSWSMLFLGHASPYSNNGYALGQTSKRWQTAYLVSSPNVSSDINTKENVRYIDDNVSLLSDDSITTSDFLSFIENDLKLARYDYKINQETYDEFDDIAKANSLQASQNQLGFIAQDVKDTKVGSILIQEDIDGLLSYNTGNLTSIIAGALQEEIKQRKNLEEEVKQLKELVNKLLEKGDE